MSLVLKYFSCKFLRLLYYGIFDICQIIISSKSDFFYGSNMSPMSIQEKKPTHLCESHWQLYHI